ncbi:tail fiber assembly protein [Enterobacter kobei]|uniref:tail fiber assembly protein n=1 Tax=Enterobacter kobei TaxID=208224 RepID=UPI003CF2BBE1
MSLRYDPRIWQYCAEGVGIAAGSYTDKPAKLDDNTKAIRRTADGSAWEVVDDLRGQLAYSTDPREENTVDFIGPLPDGWTLLSPQTPFDKWVTDTDAKHAAEVAAAQVKLEALNQEADEIIEQLNCAVKYDMATDEEKASLEEWEKYSVLLSRVSPEKPDWPVKPE